MNFTAKIGRDKVAEFDFATDGLFFCDQANKHGIYSQTHPDKKVQLFSPSGTRVTL